MVAVPAAPVVTVSPAESGWPAVADAPFTRTSPIALVSVAETPSGVGEGTGVGSGVGCGVGCGRSWLAHELRRRMTTKEMTMMGERILLRE